MKRLEEFLAVAADIKAGDEVDGLCGHRVEHSGDTRIYEGEHPVTRQMGPWAIVEIRRVPMWVRADQKVYIYREVEAP